MLLSNSLIQMVRNWCICWNLGDISQSLPGAWDEERKDLMSKMEKGTTTPIRLSMCTWLSVVCNTLLVAWVRHICPSSCACVVSVVKNCSCAMLSLLCDLDFFSSTFCVLSLSFCGVWGRREKRVSTIPCTLDLPFISLERDFQPLHILRSGRMKGMWHSGYLDFRKSTLESVHYSASLLRANSLLLSPVLLGISLISL